MQSTSMYMYIKQFTFASAASPASRDRVTCLIAQISADVSVVDSTLLSAIIRMVLTIIVCLYVYVIEECITLASEASLASRDRVTCLIAQMSEDVSVVESTLLSDLIRRLLLVIVCVYVYVIEE